MRVHAPRSAFFDHFFRWGGALLFLASLGYFLFSYLTTFGATGGVPAGSALTWNVAVFTLFAMHHSIFARERVRRWVAQTLGAHLERSFYVWIASLLFLLVCASWRPIAGIAWQADGLLRRILWILQATGLWLAVGSAAILDIGELAGIRMPAGRLEFKTNGPYGWIRHPIYSGWFLFVFAASPMTMTRLTFAVVSSIYVLIAIPWEERGMRAASGGAYERYAAHVPWRLIPGIY